jgi:hypothetical protein
VPLHEMTPEYLSPLYYGAYLFTELPYKEYAGGFRARAQKRRWRHHSAAFCCKGNQLPKRKHQKSRGKSVHMHNSTHNAVVSWHGLPSYRQDILAAAALSGCFSIVTTCSGAGASRLRQRVHELRSGVPTIRGGKKNGIRTFTRG